MKRLPLAITLAATLTLTALCSPSIAAEVAWTRGEGQGNTEFFIDNQGMRLNVSCMAQGESRVTLSNASSLREVQRFTIRAGGETFEGPVTSGSMVGESNYRALLKLLRTSDATVSFEGKTLVFPHRGADKAIFTGRRAQQCSVF